MMSSMRTTVTLDPETAALVRRAMAERNASFKQIVNEAIVRGLTAERTPFQFRTKTHSMGRALVDLDKANQVAAALEDEEFVRKAALGR
jgi:hypothetical protein